MKTWTEKGPGRKRCPACPLYVGVRSRQCSCGHSFTAAKPAPQRRYSRFQPKQGEPSETEPSVDQRPVLITPCGPCPVELTDTDEATVLAWADAVRTACKKVRLTNIALRYYVRQFFSFHSDNYRTAAAHLQGI